MAELLDWREVAGRRAGSWLGRPLIYRERVDSTNTLAASLIPHEAPPGAVIVADYQQAGRGRLGRRWVAAPGSALTFTMVLGPYAPAWVLPLVAGLATAEALARCGVQAALKWPNDVLIGDLKCAGILIEGRRVGSDTWLLAGIGINVRSVDPALNTATCLDAHAPAAVRREDLLADLLACTERWCQRGIEESAAVRSAWKAQLVTIGRRVVAHTPAGVIAGLAADVAEDGALLLSLPDGSVRALSAGDVTLAAGPRAHSEEWPDRGGPSGSSRPASSGV